MEKFDPSRRGAFPVVKKHKSMRRVHLEIAVAVVLAILFATFLSVMVNR